MKKDGGWFEFESYQSAYKFCETDRKHFEYWQPCKICNPEQVINYARASGYNHRHYGIVWVGWLKTTQEQKMIEFMN